MKRMMLLVVAIVLASLAAGWAWDDLGGGKAVAARPGAMWAVVDLNISAVPPVATLARGNGAVSATATGTDGAFVVTFDRDVSQCAYAATAGESRAFTTGPDDAITFGVGPSNTGPNDLFLIEYDAILARDSYSSGFHLIVAC